MTAEFPLAVHALVYLYKSGKVTTSNELAENICTNPARVRKVMTLLKNSGLISSGRGKDSGYSIFGENGDITLAQVMSALEEEPVFMKWRSGDESGDCLISSGMGKTMDGIYSEMNKLCNDYLSDITIRDIANNVVKRQDDKQKCDCGCGCNCGCQSS
ncbi:RrF2 family transcriptional regulator [Howardella ureilytica]|nr:Rrf2 family transcriptional regulator [Lachnospiraceae bacterium]MDY2957318.1 Rrf2 family transcriptional regulator [Lachnospiraceae bacterium]